MDVLTMWFLTNYRHAPGHFFGIVGFVQIALGLFLFLNGLALWAASRPAGGNFSIGIGLLFAMAGAVMISIGLLAEFMLRHFVRIDPALYVAEENERVARPK